MSEYFKGNTPITGTFTADDWFWIRSALFADVLRRKTNNFYGATVDNSGRSASLAQNISDLLGVENPLSAHGGE